MNKIKFNYKNVDFDKMNGLVPAVVVDYLSNSVIMLGFMNKEALKKTLDSGKVTFFSRTRNVLWTKGETSGNFLFVKEIKSDCDQDSLLIRCEPVGNSCHTGEFSCFNEDKYYGISFLSELYRLILSRKKEMPEGSYTTRLFRDGENRIIQKVGEEAIETIIAAKNRDKEEIINETSDLLYHLFVMLAMQEITPKEIVDNLQKRHLK